MAKQKMHDPFAAARKYAGKNTAEVLGHQNTDIGIPAVKPFVVVPNGRSFDEAGWNPHPKGKGA